jgi:hypothetical protein
MLCTPTISNVMVTKTLIDGGAGLNVISIETFETLQVPYSQLMPTRPFSGVTDGSTIPLGQVRLPVTFGTRKNYHTELINFDVAHIGLPYSAILGYPALTKFMAATHHAYNVLKMPGCSGIITVTYDEKDMICSLEHAYKAAAIEHPADEDMAEPPEAAPAKKKQLFSQDRAETKKVSVDGSSSGPAFTIGAGLPPA